MKNLFALVILMLTASVLSFSQPLQTAAIADESLRLCLASTQARQFEVAVTDCGKSISKSPDKHEGYLGRAIAYTNLKNFEAAVADFSKVLQLAPKNGDALSWRGEVYLAMEKYNLALADFNKVLQLFPNNPVALYRRAIIYSKTGKKDLAVADLKIILAANPNLPEVKTALAQLEATMKPYEYEGKKLSTPEDFIREADTAYFQSMTYQRREQYFNLLSNCFARLPDEYECAKKLLDFYQQETLLDTAPSQGGLNARTKFNSSLQARWIESNLIPLYTAVLKKDPKNINAYYMRALRYLEDKNYEAAIADLTKVLEDNPKSHRIYSERAKAYLALKKYDPALADATKAFENTTDSTLKRFYQQDQINIYVAAQKYDAAISAADKLLVEDPPNMRARLARGIALRGQGKNDLAIAEFTKVISDYPNLEQAYRDRAATYRVVGKNDLAAADEKKADQLKTGK